MLFVWIYYYPFIMKLDCYKRNPEYVTQRRTVFGLCNCFRSVHFNPLAQIFKKQSVIFSRHATIKIYEQLPTYIVVVLPSFCLWPIQHNVLQKSRIQNLLSNSRSFEGRWEGNQRVKHLVMFMSKVRGIAIGVCSIVVVWRTTLVYSAHVILGLKCAFQTFFW